MKRCPTCARPAPDDLTFCVEDGSPLAATPVQTFADLSAGERRVPVARALRLARGLCDAWSRAGGRVPPATVPLEVEVGEGDRVSVTFAHDAAPAATDAHELDPTAPYAAPETFPGGGAVTEAASVYHVAALVHHLLTGAPPFDGSTTAAVAVRKLLEDPPSARALRADVPAALDAALVRALDRDPARRFATLAELAAACDAAAPDALDALAPASFGPPPSFASAPPAAFAPAPPPAPLAPPRRGPPRALLATGGALVVVAALAGLSLTRTRTRPDAVAPSAADTPSPAQQPQHARRAEAPPSVPTATSPMRGAQSETPPPAAPAPAPAPALSPAPVEVLHTRPSRSPTRRPTRVARARPPAAGARTAPGAARAPLADVGNVGLSGSGGGPANATGDPLAPSDTLPRPRIRPRTRMPAPVPPPAPPPAAPAEGEGAPATRATTPPPTPAPVGAVERTPAPIPTPPVSTPPPAPPQPSEGPSPLPLVLALAAGLAGLVLVGVGLLLRRRAATPPAPPPAYPPAPPAYAPPVYAPPTARPAHIPATAVIPTDGAATVPDAPVWQGTSPDALAQTIAATPPPSGVWCARCGTPSPADARFCPTDGADLRTHGTTVDPNARPPTDTRPDMKPFAVGRYRCESRLGEGGMGVVYRASDVETGAACAVKVLLVRGRAEGPLAERFRKEARLAAAVRHPNCVAIYDYGEVAGQLFYLAMELVDGRSLDAALEGRAMPPPRVASIVGQVCDALAAAHAAGIVHRDLKPQNVMVRDGDVVKLVDFGIARDLNAAKTTLAGVVVGTPAYMAPEQARAEAGVDGRADVFSVGVMAWELLTGRLPYEPAGNAIQQVVARATLRDSAPPTGVSPAVDDVLARATAPDPARRTPDVRTLAAELGAALQAA